MAGSTGRCLKRLMALTLIFLFWVTITNCRDDKQGSSQQRTNDGRLPVKLVWQPRGSGDAVTSKASPSGDVCTDYLITGIRVRVKGPNDMIVKESEVLPCALRTTQMDGIKAGSEYRVQVEGLIGDQVKWFGEKTGVEIVAGQGTDIVVVEMTYQGETEAPAASVHPADQAVDVPTNTAITVRFTKSMVAASVDDNSISVQHGDDPVSGTVTYNDETYEAVFKPDQELAISSVYTVKVTTGVVDRTGQPMASDLLSQFTTTTVWYVDGTRPSSGSGNSWAEAFRTIAEAIGAASEDHQIWVKSGTYLLDEQIMVNKPIELLGGFAGTETHTFQRDWTRMETIIDGQGNGRCFYLSSPATVDGFTVTGGLLETQTLPHGGAMYIDGVAAQILNSNFRGNVVGALDGRGGAVYIAGGDPLFDGCIFSDNKAHGGSSSYGGAIYNNQGRLTISNSVFKNNQSRSSYDGHGGAIYNNSAKPDTKIIDCLFISNVAFGEHAYGGAISNGKSDGNQILISRCRFKGNTCSGSTASGGAIDNSTSNAHIQNCVFDANRSMADSNSVGGAISNHGGAPAIDNCTFSFNVVEIGEHDIENNTFGGSAVASFGNSAVPSVGNCNTTMTNSIIWDNFVSIGSSEVRTDQQIFDEGDSTTSVSFTNIDQDLTGTNLIRQRPRFGADLHLRSGSPGIGIADTAAAAVIDIDGEARPHGKEADLGADEYIDIDSDQLPDFWETAHGLGDATDDADSDHISNLSEYHLGSNPNASNPVLNAEHRGAVGSTGNHQASDLSTPVGDSTDHFRRSFFVFDVSDATKPVTAVAVRLELAHYNSDAVPLSFQIWDVSTTAPQLAADSSGQPGIDIYNDLGSGLLFAEFAPNPTDEGTVLDIRLNQAAIDAVNAARTGSGKFIIGLRRKSSMDTGQLSFSEAGEPRVHQLVLVEE